MLTPIIFTLIVIVVLMLALSGLSEIIYQLFGKGKRLRLVIHSDNEFKKELDFEGGEKLLSILQTKGFNISSGCGGNATCGQCKVKLLTNMGTYAPTEAPLFDSMARKETREFLEEGKGDGYTRLSCQVRVDKDVDIYLPGSTLHVKKYTARVLKKIQLTSDKYETHLHPFQKFDFIPGQYIQIRLPDDYVEEHYKEFGEKIQCYCKEIDKRFIPYTPGLDIYRAYSLATTKTEPLKLITRIAPINPRVPIEKGGVPCIGPRCIKDYIQDESIWNLWVGDRIRFTGPYGNFHLVKEKHQAVFVAGGAGLAPILALMEQWFNEGRHESIFFFLGERRFQDIPLRYISRWLKQEKEFSNFKFIPVLSGAFKGDDPAEMDSLDKECLDQASDELKGDILEEGLIDESGDKWSGKTGFIGPLLTEYLSPGADTVFYLCGPAPMTVTVIDSAANNLGIEKDRVQFDDFTGTLTPSLDLIYQNIELKKKIEALHLLHADEYLKKISLILIIKLILRDKIDDSYTFLDKVKNIVDNDGGSKEAALESLLKEYD
ncbi:MAG: 2Fe-2S iron-sulfur cluster-binding protein [Candidatus Scalindua sp.]|nr:2Fe-2S iron-sulfur cluster-binding protein [Candidatus Scalindua sp.]